VNPMMNPSRTTRLLKKREVGEEAKQAPDVRRYGNKPKQNENQPSGIMEERASLRNYGWRRRLIRQPRTPSWRGPENANCGRRILFQRRAKLFAAARIQEAIQTPSFRGDAKASNPESRDSGSGAGAP